MPLKIGIAQINSTVGDFTGNSRRVLRFAQEAAPKCDLVVFPESCLFGYPPFDLLEQGFLVREQLKALQRIHKMWPKNLVGVVGVIAQNPKKRGRPYFNSAVWIEKGKALRFFHKQLLPTGDVFDEARFFECGKTARNLVKFMGQKILLTICEDIWAWPNSKGESVYTENPLLKLRTAKPDLVLNLSASPYHPKKLKIRQSLVDQTRKLFRAPVVYVNMVGAQDELIFDGGSFAVNAKGDCVAQASRFQEELLVFEVGQKKTAFGKDVTENLKQALVLGIRDFCQKTGLRKVHLGLSGGIDSALVACLATEALGPENVASIALPGPFSAKESALWAQRLAGNLGISFRTLSIADTYEYFVNELKKVTDLGVMTVAHENLQARLRGIVLMAISNAENSLLLSTANKSEYATGYATLYGDMCGGLAPLGDLTKAQVYQLAKMYSQIPQEIIQRPPSAELRPDQKDEDSLPPYTKLDPAVVRVVEEDRTPGNDVERWLLRRIGQTEFKRWQAPPILKVSQRSFGRGRRWPVAWILE